MDAVCLHLSDALPTSVPIQQEVVRSTGRSNLPPYSIQVSFYKQEIRRKEVPKVIGTCLNHARKHVDPRMQVGIGYQRVRGDSIVAIPST